MGKIDALLEQRIDSRSHSKVQALALHAREGGLSSFSGLFKVGKLSDKEKKSLETILLEYRKDSSDITHDLEQLTTITSEVKAIHNQAALLHGERISKVQKLLSRYRDGAFSSWLLGAYGNRQTPYNFLLYYEFSEKLSYEQKTALDLFPRQVIYSLASRDISMEEKQAFLQKNVGKTKQEMLELLRAKFPLKRHDRRKTSGQAILTNLVRLFHTFARFKDQIEEEKKKEIKLLLEKFENII
jgi:hypothetical protein